MRFSKVFPKFLKGITKMNTLSLLEEKKDSINVMEYKELILAWAESKAIELNRYCMESNDFFNSFWIKFEMHKGALMESARIHKRQVKSFIMLLCNRHLIDLRRKHIKQSTLSIDVEVFEGETIADNIQDEKSFDLSLMFEMLDSIPDKKATKNFSYKELFQIILDEGNEPLRLSQILDVSQARVSQIVTELIRYCRA